jgi:U4/U6.U5 tri-snRNP component SNU23
MSDRKAGAYGTSNDDVGRRTFDREAALERSKAREAKEREDSKLAYQAKLEGRKYFKRAATPEDIKETAARSERRNYQDLIGKVSLVSGSVGQGRRGKGTGVFWCQICDLNFSNSSEFLVKPPASHCDIKLTNLAVRF